MFVDESSSSRKSQNRRRTVEFIFYGLAWKRGYWKITERRGKMRPKKQEPTKSILVKMPEALYKQLKIYSYERGQSMTAVVIEKLSKSLK